MTSSELEGWVLKQGQYDGLCGLFAVLNALRWLDRFSRTRSALPGAQGLFDEAVASVSKMRGVTLKIVQGEQGGLVENRIVNLCRRLIKTYGLRVRLEPVSTCDKSFDSYSQLINYAISLGGNQPVAIISPCDNDKHWTVFARGESQSFRLDSGVGYESSKIDGRVYRHFSYGEGVVLYLKM